MSKILIIEDEEKIARFIELELKYEGYEVVKASDGRQGLELIENDDFDLVLLDIMLPELNGTEVLRRLRRVSQVPVIMLTALDNVTDKVSSLDGGANDYLTKPFAIEELLARIRTQLRRGNNDDIQSSQTLLVGALQLDPISYEVKYQGQKINLTKREFDLLRTLMESKGLVLSRDILLEKVWGYNYVGETNTVDVYIRYLRSKIDDVFSIKMIHTVRGVGYVLKEE